MRNIIKNLKAAEKRSEPIRDSRTDGVRVTVYAVERTKTGEIVYVGASTNPEARWWRSASAVKSEKIVHLEETILLHQVERETFWIEEMLRRGHQLRNISAPQKIHVSPHTHELPRPSRERSIGKRER